jgi:hypothetical protein
MLFDAKRENFIPFGVREITSLRLERQRFSSVNDRGRPVIVVEDRADFVEQG